MKRAYTVYIILGPFLELLVKRAFVLFTPHLLCSTLVCTSPSHVNMADLRRLVQQYEQRERATRFGAV